MGGGGGVRAARLGVHPPPELERLRRDGEPRGAAALAERRVRTRRRIREGRIPSLGIVLGIDRRRDAERQPREFHRRVLTSRFGMEFGIGIREPSVAAVSRRCSRQERRRRRRGFPRRAH